MKREAGEGSEDKQTSSDRDEFRRQQDIERENYRKDLESFRAQKKRKGGQIKRLVLASKLGFRLRKGDPEIYNAPFWKRFRLISNIVLFALVIWMVIYFQGWF